MNIDISVVSYNTAKWLENFFNSLRLQTYPLRSLNIYVRNNASTDNTQQVLEKIKAEMGDVFGQFVVTGGPNQGYGSGHNANFKRSHSPLFLVTNEDLEFEKDAIAEIVASAKSASETVASFELRQKPYEHPKYYDPVTLNTRWSSSACVLFRRSAFEKIGGYEERIFMYGEDVEISYRLRDHGYSLLYCPRAVCWHYSYSKPFERKKNLAWRNLIANASLRLRYGTFVEALRGVIVLILMRHFSNIPYYLNTRKKSDTTFRFIGRDYDYSREGAFYTCQKYPDQPLPLVSVITRTCPGRINFLRQSVATILNQTYPNIELIVVEDGGTTAEHVAHEIKQQHRLTRVIYESITKSGRSEAGNRGLALATGDYAMFLDDDDLLFADHVEVLALKLREQSSYVAAYSLAAEFSDLNTKPKTVWNQVFSRELLLSRNYFPIQSVMFRRTVFLSQGGFDSQFDALEDWDLWLRFSTQGDFYFVEKLTSLYRVPNSAYESYCRKKIFLAAYPKIMRKYNIHDRRSQWRYRLNTWLTRYYGIYYLYCLTK